uniref:Uncharacterized protein n=1 Tax=Aegilops tauschii subsp. strangulata TaxID=200361 RepID=A0A453BLH5_AEGTS
MRAVCPHGNVLLHALKVMNHVGVLEIPKRHILKRWTKDARDILPQHIVHFQKDQAANQSFTCRSSTLYLHAMELVRIGESSISAYELVFGRIKDLIIEVSSLAEKTDGLGIEDRIAAESSRKNNGSVGAIINIDAQMGDNENQHDRVWQLGCPRWFVCSKQEAWCWPAVLEQRESVIRRLE